MLVEETYDLGNGDRITVEHYNVRGRYIMRLNGKVVDAHCNFFDTGWSKWVGVQDDYKVYFSATPISLGCFKKSRSFDYRWEIHHVPNFNCSSI